MGQLTQTTVETQGLLDDVPNKAETASDVGLGNVDNTSDVNKPVSTATQTALDGKDKTRFNTVYVGTGGDYAQIQDALDSITDASESNRYTIKIYPGDFNLNFDTKAYVDIEGSGDGTRLIGTGTQRIDIASSHVNFSNFYILWTGTSAAQNAILRAYASYNIVFDNVNGEQNGLGSFMDIGGGGGLLTWQLRNMIIRSEHVGLRLGSTVYADNVRVLMHGNNTGQTHIGLEIEDTNGRLYLNNCRFGTGYWADDVNGVLTQYKIYGADNIYGIHLAGTATDTRVEIHGLESFCRNEDTDGPAVEVNVIRVEGGWVRAFGCFGQSETPDPANVYSLYQSGDGKIEQYGCRFSRIDGNSFGGSIDGVQTFTVADDLLLISKFEGGLHRCDASSGAFTLKMELLGYAMTGTVHTFMKTDGSANIITLDLNGATLEGSAINPTLTAQYESLKIIYDGVEWVNY